MIFSYFVLYILYKLKTVPKNDITFPTNQIFEIEEINDLEFCPVEKKKKVLKMLEFLHLLKTDVKNTCVINHFREEISKCFFFF